MQVISLMSYQMSQGLSYKFLLTAVNSNSYNVFPGPSHEESTSYQLSPKTSFSESANGSGHESGSGSDDQDEPEEEAGASAPKRKKVSALS